jgi:hypothetical protein
MIDPTFFVVLSLHAALAATLGEAIRRDNVAAAVNAFVGLVAALVPTVVEVVYFTAPGPDVYPELSIWIAVAGFLHSLGMLGLYESTQWWDHVTHTVSAALVAALLYAVVLTAGTPSLDRPFAAAALTLGSTLLVGVLWELVELLSRRLAERYDIEPVLVHYGWRDTVYDLVFDAVGALVVLVVDLRTFVPLVERLSALV